MVILKPPQGEVFQCAARFRVLVAGRRFGKTFLALTELIRAALRPGCLAWYVCPSYRMAKRICWKLLKEMTRPFWASKPNETDLRIELISGGSICLKGADNYDSLRGDGLDFLVLDEYASMAPEAWTEVLRAALADRARSSVIYRDAAGLQPFPRPGRSCADPRGLEGLPLHHRRGRPCHAGRTGKRGAGTR